MALVCWKCGASLEELSLPLLRLDECPQCHAELHVCKMCEWYSVAVAKQCRETIAEEVKDKERANFCDYFKPKQDAYTAVSVDAATKAKTDLEALFGSGGSKSGEGTEPTAAEKARAELEALFGKKKD